MVYFWTQNHTIQSTVLLCVLTHVLNITEKQHRKSKIYLLCLYCGGNGKTISCSIMWKGEIFFIESRVSCILIMRVSNCILTKLVDLRCTYWHLQYQNNILFERKKKAPKSMLYFGYTFGYVCISFYRQHPTTYTYVCDCR